MLKFQRLMVLLGALTATPAFAVNAMACDCKDCPCGPDCPCDH